jgi:transposase
MSRLRKRYTKEEKLEIVLKSLEPEHSVKDLAERFEISENSIYNWRKSYLKNKENAFPGKGNQVLSEPERKIKELEKELREMKLERDILKKAVGIFSKSDKKFSNL